MCKFRRNDSENQKTFEVQLRLPQCVLVSLLYGKCTLYVQYSIYIEYSTLYLQYSTLSTVIFSIEQLNIKFGGKVVKYVHAHLKTHFRNTIK